MFKPSYLFIAILTFISLLAWDHAGVDLPAMTVFERFLGLGAMFLLAVTLMMGPAAVLMPQQFASLIEPRKAVGLASFAFLVPHFAIIFANFMNYDVAMLFGAPQLALGLAAMVIMLALALTSPDPVLRMLGNNNWKTLHRMVYIAFIFAVYHSAVQITSYGLGKSGEMNASQIAVLAVSALAIVMQLAGFYVRRQRASASNDSGGQKKPNVPAEPAQ